MLEVLSKVEWLHKETEAKKETKRKDKATEGNNTIERGRAASVGKVRPAGLSRDFPTSAKFRTGEFWRPVHGLPDPNFASHLPRNLIQVQAGKRKKNEDSQANPISVIAKFCPTQILGPPLNGT